MPTAEIIAIGTELLLGETVDTNTRFIARTLRGLGADIYRAQTVGDNAGRIAETLRQALERADFVITTGGLGPTVDDPTRQAIAAAFGLELEFRPDLWEQIAARIACYGRTPTENQKRQAYVPAGAIPIPNPVGTAPAFIVEIRPAAGSGLKAVIALPGVPGEMETLLADAVVPYLRERFDLRQVIKVRSLHVSGVGEGVLDERIGDLETLANPTVGLSAHSGVVSIRVTAKADDEAGADRMIAAVEGDLRARLGEDLFGADEQTLEGAALAAVAARTWSLVAVESGTGGALAERLSRAGHPAFVYGAPAAGPDAAALAAAVGRVRSEHAASAALGLSVEAGEGQSVITICLVTPLEEEVRRLTYGGHPRSAVRWGVNMALDWLRRAAREEG